MGIEHQTEKSSWLWTGGHYRDDSPMPRFCPKAIGARSFPQQGAQLPTIKMMDFANICLKDTQVSARGAKSCQVRGQDGTRITFTLGTSQEPVTTPFGATSFTEGEGGRKTLEFSLSPEQEKEWQAFDDAAVEYLVKHSFRLFKALKTEAQIRENYRSPVSKKGDYRATLRCKVNVDGSHTVRCWDVNRARVDLPEDLRDTELVAKVMLSHLWMMSKEYGFVALCTDLQVRSSSAECPFEEAGAFGGA
jgi:hypothetical protein